MPRTRRGASPKKERGGKVKPIKQRVVKPHSKRLEAIRQRQTKQKPVGRGTAEPRKIRGGKVAPKKKTIAPKRGGFGLKKHPKLKPRIAPKPGKTMPAGKTAGQKLWANTRAAWDKKGFTSAQRQARMANTKKKLNTRVAKINADRPHAAPPRPKLKKPYVPKKVVTPKVRKPRGGVKKQRPATKRQRRR